MFRLESVRLIILMDAINSKIQKLHSVGVCMAVQMVVQLLNPGSFIRKAIGRAFEREVSKKKFSLAASEWLSSPFERKLSVAALRFILFYNFSLDFYKTIVSIRMRPSAIRTLLQMFHCRVFQLQLGFLYNPRCVRMGPSDVRTPLRVFHIRVTFFS